MPWRLLAFTLRRRAHERRRLVAALAMAGAAALALAAAAQARAAARPATLTVTLSSENPSYGAASRIEVDRAGLPVARGLLIPGHGPPSVSFTLRRGDYTLRIAEVDAGGDILRLEEPVPLHLDRDRELTTGQ